MTKRTESNHDNDNEHPDERQHQIPERKRKRHETFDILAPQFSTTTITMFVFGYLAMVTVILIMTANPSQSTAPLDFGPQSVAASTHTVAVEIPVVQIPAAPYLIVEPAN